MVQAILYTSNTGTTAQYAHLLGQRTGLPVYPADAASAVPGGAEIIYLGWIMAGGVKGYKRACASWRVRALCGVGMGATGSQLDELRTKNAVPQDVALFTLCGGFDLQKLHGAYRMMMTLMSKTAGKALAKKQDRTPEEDAMLNMLLHGANCVREESLAAVLDWFRANGGAATEGETKQ